MGGAPCPDETPETSPAERLVARFSRDAALRPVALVVIAHLVLGMVVLLLAALRSRSLVSLAVLSLLLLASADALRDDVARRHFGPLGGTVLATWMLGALVAWSADHRGALRATESRAFRDRLGSMTLGVERHRTMHEAKAMERKYGKPPAAELPIR